MRYLVVAAAAAVLALVGAGAGHAQERWPAKAVHWIVPYAAGGFADIRSRRIGLDLATAIGQPVVIENRTGAGGVVGTDAIAKAAPDGYTIGMANLASLAVNVSLMKKLPYDPVKDLAPVVLVEKSPLILSVALAVPATSLPELIALAKAKPGQLAFASSGVGGAHHLSGEMLRQRSGIEIVHIPYKGGAPAATDLIAGHVPMMFEMGYAAIPSIKAGKVRALAVTSAQRLALLPDVPTMAEAGLPGFESYNWQGVVAPAGTPREIVERLNREINAILAKPDQREAIAATGSQVGGGTPEEFREFIRVETAKWARVVKDANIQPE
jgi:tripartite-type tricarboxylate transporter receptor subunit TctC